VLIEKKKALSLHNYKVKQSPNMNFYNRVNNLSRITFTEEEVNLLKLGFQYSIERPIAPYLTNTVIETENAIRLLNMNEQSAYRILANKKLKQIIDS
jgi:hypothetical protein